MGPFVGVESSTFPFQQQQQQQKWPFHLRRAINSGARDSKSKWIGLRGSIPSKRREKNQKK